MAQLLRSNDLKGLNIFDLPELLEQILYFLEIDRSIYPALFVNRLWYKCGIPLLWRRVELKGNDIHYGHYFPVEYNYCERYRTRVRKFHKADMRGEKTCLCLKPDFILSFNYT